MSHPVDNNYAIVTTPSQPQTDEGSPLVRVRAELHSPPLPPPRSETAAAMVNQ